MDIEENTPNHGMCFMRQKKGAFSLTLYTILLFEFCVLSLQLKHIIYSHMRNSKEGPTHSLLISSLVTQEP